MDAIVSVPYDGCTRLDSFVPPKEKTNFVLLFTDGLSAVGGDVPAALNQLPPIYPVGGSNPSTNHVLLTFWASQTGTHRVLLSLRGLLPCLTANLFRWRLPQHFQD